MRIAIICCPWDPVGPIDGGGSIPIIAYRFARCLARDHKVTIYGRRLRGEPHFLIDQDGIVYRRIPVRLKHYRLFEILLGIIGPRLNRRLYPVFSGVYHLFYAIRVAVDLHKKGAEIIHIIDFSQFVPIIRCFNRNARFVLHMECDWLTQLGAAVVKRTEVADLVIGCSDYITNRVRTRFPALSGKCRTVYNGVDIGLFCPKSSSAPGVTGTVRKRLLFVAGISPEKGVHVLIEAFQELVRRGFDVHLDLVGVTLLRPYVFGVYNSPEVVALNKFYGNSWFDRTKKQLVYRGRRYLCDLLSDLPPKVSERITYHGARSHTQILEFYRSATVFVFPSVWDEPFGMPIVEAMACGLPVVATRGGGIPEIIHDGKTGILVSKGNATELHFAIARLLDDPDLCASLGEAGCRRAKEVFSWNIVAENLSSCYDSVSARP